MKTRFTVPASLTLLSLTYQLAGVSAFAQTLPSRAEIYRSTLPAHSTTEISTHLSDFLHRDIMKKAGTRPVVITENLGFSGAGYAGDQFAKDFTELSNEFANINDAVSVQVMGGSKDGFGMGYDLVPTKNTIVAGMVADQAVGYHVEGQQKGWGDVISPRNEAIYLVPTHKDASGNEVWEVKRSSTGVSQTSELLVEAGRTRGVKSTRMVAFEGGAIALQEMIEYVLNKKSEDYGSRPKAELLLVVGYETGKAAKDKGPRAASQMAMILRDHPELLSHNLNVKIAQAGNVGQRYTVAEFFATPYGKSSRFKPSAFKAYAAKERAFLETLALTENTNGSEAEMKALKAKVDAAEARVRMAQAMYSTEATLQKTVADLAHNAKVRFEVISSALANPNTPIHRDMDIEARAEAYQGREESLLRTTENVLQTIKTKTEAQFAARAKMIEEAKNSRSTREGEIKEIVKAARKASKR